MINNTNFLEDPRYYTALDQIGMEESDSYLDNLFKEKMITISVYTYLKRVQSREVIDLKFENVEEQLTIAGFDKDLSQISLCENAFSRAWQIGLRCHHLAPFFPEGIEKYSRDYKLKQFELCDASGSITQLLNETALDLEKIDAAKIDLFPLPLSNRLCLVDLIAQIDLGVRVGERTIPLYPSFKIDPSRENRLGRERLAYMVRDTFRQVLVQGRPLLKTTLGACLGILMSNKFIFTYDFDPLNATLQIQA